MQVELVRTFTRDNLRLDGALAPATQARSASEVPTLARSASKGSFAAILLHGVAGNFYTSSTFEPLVPALQQVGLDVLLGNTRGHDSVFGAVQGFMRRRFGAAYEIVDECRHDIAAWIDFLLARGHKQVVLIGHSLGAIKAVYFQAMEKHPQVAAIVAASPPRLSYSAFMNAPESSTFFESMSTAQQLVTEGRGDELFTSKFPFPLLITGNAYVDKYGPAERYNILKFADQVPCPALFTYGSKELDQGGIAFAGLPDALRALAGSDGRQIAVIDAADHMYSGVTEKLAAEITQWVVR